LKWLDDLQNANWNLRSAKKVGEPFVSNCGGNLPHRVHNRTLIKLCHG